MTPLEGALAAIESWGADHASGAVIGPDGVLATHGDPAHRYRWASVTKLATAWAVLSARDRGLLGLDEPAGPPESTVRHLLSHASGLPFDGEATLAAPGKRRIYSNTGFDVLGHIVEQRTGAPFAAALESWVLEPLGMAGAVLLERPSQGLHGPLDDLVALAGELLRPTLLSPATAAEAITVAFPGLVGVVPGVGRFDPCDWGLGPELHDGKTPHWMADENSPEAFGHTGGSGSFVWLDPVARLGLVVATDRPFGPWSLQAWPALSAAVLLTSGVR
jgi:CubicO group peptidase (beta-lactamase class C family)